jgi:hypothetical protein
MMFVKASDEVSHEASYVTAVTTDWKAVAILSALKPV